MSSFMVGRQPVVDDRGALVAYDLFYSTQKSAGASERAKSSMLVNSVLNTFGSRRMLGGRPGFIRIDGHFLLSETMLSTPREFFIFALCTSIRVTQEVLERVKMLHALGYRFALHNVTGRTGPLKRLTPLFPFLSYFKINTSEFTQQYLLKMTGALSKYPMQIMACGINDQLQFAISKSVGCSLHQGYYFAEPVIMENTAYDPELFSVVRLYNMLISDAELDKIVRAFESNQALTLQLLQYVNSAAFSFNQHIASIQQVLTLIGRKVLGQWLMLLIYGKSMNRSKYQLPLLLMATSRTKLMTELLRLVRPGVGKELEGKAFFVGVMSLADSVFSAPLHKILEEMQISEDVEQALLKREGLLGELLLQTQAIEAFDETAIAAFTKKYGIAMPAFQNMVSQTMEYVSKMETELQ